MAVGTTARRWTLEEVHRLPDDGNKYELVGGELFVTPPPSNAHQTIIARLAESLIPYVRAQGIGRVHTARSVVRSRNAEAEPDLFVRADAPGVSHDWENAPRPALVVEVLSDATRRRDLGPKRELYVNDLGIADYWIVDQDRRNVRVVRQGKEDLIADQDLTWSPSGARDPLRFDVRQLFD